MYFFELKGRITEPNAVIIIDHRAAPGFCFDMSMFFFFFFFNSNVDTLISTIGRPLSVSVEDEGRLQGYNK